MGNGGPAVDAAGLLEDLTALLACHQRLLPGYKELATSLLDYVLAETPKGAEWSVLEEASGGS